MSASLSSFVVSHSVAVAAKAATTYITRSKRGFDHLIAATDSDDNLAAGIDCIIAQYEKLFCTIFQKCLAGLHISSDL
jgi:hypothetical protein